MYTVIGNPRTRAFRAMWMLEELGEPYELEPVSPHSERARALNASGKIPILVDGDLEVADSSAILTYLADKHGALTHRAGTPARARQDAAMFQALDEIEGPLWAAAKHSFVLPEALRLTEMRGVAEKELARGLGLLTERLGAGPFVTGESFTIADLLIGHCLGWAKNAKFALPAEGPLADYMARVHGRPARARALERSARETA